MKASLTQEYLDLTGIGKIKYFHMIQLYSLGFYSGTKSQLIREYCVSYVATIVHRGPFEKEAWLAKAGIRGFWCS